MPHFTKAEIDEIASRLAVKAVKDSSFPDASELLGDEKVPILQDGKNVLAMVSDISGTIPDDLIFDGGHAPVE